MASDLYLPSVQDRGFHIPNCIVLQNILRCMAGSLPIPFSVSNSANSFFMSRVFIVFKEKECSACVRIPRDELNAPSVPEANLQLQKC